MLLDRIDLKVSLVRLLCLSNYSYRQPQSTSRLNLHKVVLSSSKTFLKNALGPNRKKISKKKSVFFNLDTIKENMDFGTKQYPNVRDSIRSYVRNNRLLFILPSHLKNIKRCYGLSSFQLTIFYSIASILRKNSLMASIENHTEYHKAKTQESEADSPEIHSVFITNDKRPVVILYNPFRHGNNTFSLEIID